MPQEYSLNIKELIEDIPIHSTSKKNWRDILLNIYNTKKNAIQKLEKHISDEYNELGGDLNIYPQQKYIFNAFKLCPLHKVKVVILGQDPYHGDGQAHGLSFSVMKGVPLPPSLKNIFKELDNDDNLVPAFDYKKSQENGPNGNLESWAKQGVLLLNTSLTVQKSNAGSHLKLWEEFTDEIITQIDKLLKNKTIIYMLWGSSSKKKKEILYTDNYKHLILESVHPSPLSARRGWFGCSHFSKCNEFLSANDRSPINFQID